MPVTLIRGTNQKPASSEALTLAIARLGDLEGDLYIGYPILGSAEGRLAIDAVFVSPTKGIVLFDLVEGASLGDFKDRQDDAANKLEAKLRNTRELVDRRNLIVSITPLTFGPGIPQSELEVLSDYPVTNTSNIEEVLQKIRWETSNSEIYKRVVSALQNISSIRQNRGKRALATAESRGGRLKRLEDSIATLDNMQSRAVIETVDGVQRIRGLAGSGKTIVLALKAAYLHAQHPEWRIAVTFNTRSLKAQFRRLINSFCISQTGEEPDWEQIRVVNAWGAPGGQERDGLYNEFCRLHEVPYLDYGTAKSQFGQEKAFQGACQRALDATRNSKPAYDAILVDEAQDFPLEFLQLCYELLDEDRRLVYAYDELQNLAGQTMPPPEKLFGSNPDGTPKVTLAEDDPSSPRRDIILEVCYRNSRPVLASAHALGFGIYRKPESDQKVGLVQMFDQPELWEEVGYQVTAGELRPGQDVTLERSSHSSPAFLEDHSPLDDLIQFQVFKNSQEQLEWLVNAIKRNLTQDELRPDDIVVINPDPLTTRTETGPIRAKLLEFGIESHVAGVTTDPDVFFVPDANSITFTGVFRAKGNEAGMVYIINGQDCHAAWNLASIRNRLFTAITRSKAWVRVLGVGTPMAQLKHEFEAVKANQFKLSFKYPTEREREHLAIVHRDVAPETRKTIKTREKNLGSLVKELESGKVHIADLDPALVERIRKLLSEEG